ncbi:hypothetical protein DFS33DRAFT_1369460, partial [Desarmillaria ectypa]
KQSTGLPASVTDIPKISCLVMMRGDEMRCKRKERTIWVMAKEIGIHFRKVDEIAGSGGNPIEVWIGEVECTAGEALQ